MKPYLFAGEKALHLFGNYYACYRTRDDGSVTRSRLVCMYEKTKGDVTEFKDFPVTVDGWFLNKLIDDKLQNNLRG